MNLDLNVNIEDLEDFIDATTTGGSLPKLTADEIDDYFASFSLEENEALLREHAEWLLETDRATAEHTLMALLKSFTQDELQVNCASKTLVNEKKGKSEFTSQANNSRGVPRRTRSKCKMVSLLKKSPEEDKRRKSHNRKNEVY